MKESDFYFREIPLAAGGHPRDRDSCLFPSPFFLFPPDRCSWKQQSSCPHRGAPPVRSGEKRKGWKQEVAQQKATAMVVKEVAVAVGMGRGRAAEGDCPPGLRALALPPL